MPHFWKNNTISSSHFKMKRDDIRKEIKDYSLMLGIINEVIYIDDARNNTKNTASPQVLYTVTVISGNSCGKTFYNAISMVRFSSPINSEETIHHPCVTEDFSGSNAKLPTETSGEIVVLSRIEGSPDGVVILGSLPHAKSSISPATKSDGIRQKTVFNKIETEITPNGAYSVTNTNATNPIQDAVKATVAQVTDKVNEMKASIDATIAKYNAVPHIDLSQEMEQLETFKSNLDNLSPDNIDADSLTNMADGLASFAGAPVSVSQVRGIASSVSSLGDMVSFPNPPSFKLTEGGDAKMGTTLQNMSIDPYGQASIAGIGGMGQKFGLGGTSTTTSPIMNMSAPLGLNISSLLTKIGSAPVPAARVADTCVGVTSSGESVICNIVSGSNVSMC